MLKLKNIKPKMTVSLLIVILTLGAFVNAQPWDHGKLKVSTNGRFIVHQDNEPFFYLADTAWELFHRTTREEVDTYLECRKKQGFTVIQAVMLAEASGHSVPNSYGHLPFKNKNPNTPAVVNGDNNDYWDHVEYIIDKAAEKGIYIAALPTWGSFVCPAWSADYIPVLFPNTTTAASYGHFLASRFKNRPNLIWIMGGDRSGKNGGSKSELAVFRAMANAINDEDPNHLMTYHPAGSDTSSKYFHNDSWLDFNMFQSGHKRDNAQAYSILTADYNKKPIKPVLDGEPRYEDIAVGFKIANGRIDAYDVRQAAYWAVFAGGFGHAYGNNNIWQMWKPGYYSLYNAATPWNKAMYMEGSQDMQHVKKLMLSRPFTSRVPDQTIISGDAGDGANHMQATRGDGYMFIYFSLGQSKTINLGKISGTSLKGWWYNPRNGTAKYLGKYKNSGNKVFDAPGETARGNDWILVLDDSSKIFSKPGVAITSP